MPTISESTDYPLRLQCGCRVVFLASAAHRRERMEPCSLHAGPRFDLWRIHTVNEAKERLRMMKQQRR